MMGGTAQKEVNMEQIDRDFTGMATNAIYKEVRKMLTEDFLEFLGKKYKKVARISNTEVAVVLGFVNDEDGFPQDVCAVCKAQSKPFYSKKTDENGEDLKREVVQFNIDDMVDDYVKEQKAKAAKRKSPENSDSNVE